MALALNTSGTKTMPIGTVTMTIATPAVVSFTAHGLAAGDTVVFSTTGALPTGVTAGTTYFVIAAGLTSNAFEISTTSGGSAVNTTGSQSGTHSIVAESRLTTITTVGIYRAIVDVAVLAAADQFEFRIYYKVLTGGAERQAYPAIPWYNAQADLIKFTPIIDSDISVGWSLKQLAGAARALPWKVMSY